MSEETATHLKLKYINWIKDVISCEERWKLATFEGIFNQH